MKAVDRIIEKVPGYAPMRGQVSDEAIIAHASAVYPMSTAIALAEAEIESEGFGFGLGDIFKGIKKVVGTVLKVGSSIAKKAAEKYGILIGPKEQLPTVDAVAAAVAKEKEKKKVKDKPFWLLPAIIAVVVAIVFVLVVSLTGKAK